MVYQFLDRDIDKPLLWLRYIDDIFFIRLKGEDKLKGFLQRLNSFHPALKYTHEYSQESVHFLDVVVKIEDNSLVTDLFYKPTDCHQFLHYESSHPIHIKLSIIYSHGLRIRKICTLDNDFSRHLEELRG